MDGPIEPILQVHNICKRFMANKSLLNIFRQNVPSKIMIDVLDNVSFEIFPGNIVGIIGPNGTGKTTLLRILADLMIPDNGQIHILGKLLKNDAHQQRKLIGYVSSDERSFFWRLTGRQNLNFFAGLYGFKKDSIRSAIENYLTLFNLQDKSYQLFRDYSAGTRKKFSLIRALIHKPKLLLLDELTNSLDPTSSAQIKNHIKDYISQASDRAAIWCTHRIEELTQVCHQTLTLENGQIKALINITDKNHTSDKYPQAANPKYVKQYVSP